MQHSAPYARIFATRVINGSINDVHSNRHVIDRVFPQFLDWDDIIQRATDPLFLVEVISSKNRVPDFNQVLNYCVSAKWVPSAAFKVQKLLELEFHISVGPSTFHSENFMMQVSPWSGIIYGSKKFEIL